MEVTFTTEALAAINSGVSARTSKAVEIKFTFITCIHVAASVSRTPKRSPLGPFGEMPALLTMAANLPPLSLLRTMSAKEVQALKKVLSDPALVKLKLDEHANMTTFLNYQEGKVKRHYSWSMGKTPPVPLQRAYQAVESAGSAGKL